MTWKVIEGAWRWPYRVSDEGEAQKQLSNGRWRTLKPYFYSGQLRIQLWVDDKTWKRVQISKLVVDAFMGGTPRGMLRVHRNGNKSDNAVENIIFLPPGEAAKRHRPGNSRPVMKVDRAGAVVAIYSSGSEAARANHISQQAICKRCNGKIADPYRLDGFNYVYEDRQRGRKKANG